MDTSVDALLDEMRMAGKGILSAVFENEIAFRVENIAAQNLVGNCVQAFQGIGRVGEDYVELLPAHRKEIEHVVVDGSHIGEAKACGFFADELRIVPVHLYAVDP